MVFCVIFEGLGFVFLLLLFVCSFVLGPATKNINDSPRSFVANPDRFSKLQLRAGLV